MNLMTLQEISEYRNESLPCTLIDQATYVSTESMLADKRGITAISKTPNTGNVKKYYKNDVLVSNIRPYFKKVWLAEYDGTCSNDVLVFHSTSCLPNFLYLLLSSDAFFSYMTKTSKGTKMPRGDKRAIMKYEVEVPNLQAQFKICKIMDSLQSKIKINQRLNDYLIKLATIIFESALSEECNILKFGEITTLEDSKRVPLNSRDREKRKGNYPYYGATSIMDYVDDYLFDGIRILLGEDGSVITDDGYPILQYVWGKYWVNNHAHIIKATSCYSLEMIYIALSRTGINHIVTGAVQKKISQKNLKDLSIEMPNPSISHNLEQLFNILRINSEECQHLIELRDALLPQFITGKIDISNID